MVDSLSPEEKRERVKGIYDFLFESHGLAAIADTLNVAEGIQDHLLPMTHGWVTETFSHYGMPLVVSPDNKISFPDEEVRLLVIEIFGAKVN